MLILVRPHTSLLDGLVMAAWLPKVNTPRAIFAVDPDYAHHPVWGRLLKAYGWCTGRHTMVPLDASHPFTMRKILQLLQEGRDVVIFPQGTGLENPNRPDGAGVRWLLSKTKASVVNIRLDHGGVLPAVIRAAKSSTVPQNIRAIS